MSNERPNIAGRLTGHSTTACARVEPGWHNSGYIFTDGFVSRVNFRSSVVLDALCVHECAVLGAGGRFWPAPTFRVTAMDRPGEPLVAKSCTGCWSGVRAELLLPPPSVQLWVYRWGCSHSHEQCNHACTLHANNSHIWACIPGLPARDDRWASNPRYNSIH